MGEISTVIGGGTPAADDPANFANRGYPWITPADLSGFVGIYIERGRRGLTEKGLSGSSARLVPPGTVLMSSRAPIGYVAIAANELCTNQGFKNFVCASGVEPQYVYYWLRFRRDAIEQMGSGSTFLEISGSRCKEIPIVLPPLAEQKRIAAKAEKLLARASQARQQMEKVPAILKRFRQSILASACSHGAETKIGDLLEDLKYGTARKCSSVPSGTPVLRIPNIGDSSIVHSDLKYAVLDQREKERLRLSKGDLLMIRSNGSVSLLGRTALVTEKEEGFAYAGYLLRLRVDSDRIDPSYLNLCLRSQECRDQIEMPARSTSGVHNINSEEVRNLKVMVPSLSEQHGIVRRVEALLELADAVEMRVTRGITRSEMLSQAILAKAFRGELVPQDPNDEPASRLLERIIASRQKPPAGRGEESRQRHRVTLPHPRKSLSSKESFRQKVRAAAAKSLKEIFVKALMEAFPKGRFTADELSQWNFSGGHELKHDLMFDLLGKPLAEPSAHPMVAMLYDKKQKQFVFRFQGGAGV